MSRAKALVGFVALAALAGLAFFLVVRPSDPLSDAEPPRAQALTMYGYAENGDLRWTSRASTGELVDGEGTMFDVTMTFLPGQSGSLTAYGDRVSYGSSGGNLEGHVAITRDDGLELVTDRLAWDDRSEAIEGQPILVRYEGGELAAESFDYDLNAETGRFLGGVRWEYQEEPRMTATGASATLHDGTFVLEEDVEIDAEGDRYTCAVLTVVPDQETAELSGGVTAEFADGRLEANSMERQSDGSLVARGDVRLWLDWVEDEESDGT